MTARLDSDVECLAERRLTTKWNQIWLTLDELGMYPACWMKERIESMGLLEHDAECSEQ